MSKPKARRVVSIFMILLLTGSILASGCKAQPETKISTSATSGTPASTATTPPAPSAIPVLKPPSAENPAIALTFDDGPSLRDTGKLLDILKAEDIKVTFFVLGNRITGEQKALVQREAQEGHEIANHTYSHLTLKGASTATITEELTRTNELIKQATGKTPTLFRPPIGAFDDNLKAVCQKMGLAIISWSWQSCPEDWNHRGEPGIISEFVISKAANGHIILLHDTNSTTIEALPDMIKGLKARGFRFMTVSELLASKGAGEPKSGAVYYQLTN